MNGIDILINVLYTAVVIVSVLLICLVLVQPAKSGGMGAAFGGLGQSVFGAQAGSHLTKLTVILISIFFILALSLAFLVGHRAGKTELGASLNQRAEEQGFIGGMSAPAISTEKESMTETAPVAELSADKTAESTVK